MSLAPIFHRMCVSLQKASYHGGKGTNQILSGGLRASVWVKEMSPLRHGLGAE